MVSEGCGHHTTILALCSGVGAWRIRLPSDITYVTRFGLGAPHESHGTKVTFETATCVLSKTGVLDWTRLRTKPQTWGEKPRGGGEGRAAFLRLGTWLLAQGAVGAPPSMESP